MTPDRDRDRDLEVDAAFADIVSRWNTSDATADPVPRWPVPEEVAPDDDATASEGTADPVPTRPTPAEVGRTEGSSVDARSVESEPSDPAGDPVPVGPRAWSPAEGTADEDRYIPPEPPPLPRGDLITGFAWAAVLGVPVLFLVTALFWRDIPSAVIGAAVLAFVAGFVTLVARMSDGPRDDDPGNGAVV